MSKLFLQYLVVGCFLFLLLGTVHRREPSVGLEPALAYFKKASNDFAVSTAELQAAIRLIDARDRKTVDLAKAALRNSRIHYKRIEYFLAYFFPYAAGAYNAPAKPEIEEPTLEYQEPTGLQYIEALLFEENVAARKATLLQQADLIYSSAADLNALLYNFQGDDKQLLESLRIELVRIITLTIAGFDAPLLKSGLAEAREALAVMDITLQPFLNKPGKTADSIDYYLKGARNYLKENQDFDSFDRLSFLSRQALPLQHQLNKFINEQGLELNTIPVLNGNARNIFSPEAMHLPAFTTEKNMAAGPVIQLGKILFSENALSGNNSRSCATCHQPEKYFTDGLAKSIAFSGHSIVKRNAPTLLYAGFQQTQFWDGRVKSLTDQIKMVLTSPVEMNANQQEIIKRLLQQPAYQKMFAEAFPQQKDSLITMNTIANALAAYIFTLKPFNSPFDKYLQGNKKAMSAEQIKGFNLFMGKAQCGTCHFAPLFNGLLPPYYQISEVEVLGITSTENWDAPQADADRGRYDLFPVAFYKGAFKTPTVRNTGPTGPYMHNGALSSLEKVLDFYNKGGGAGLGMKVENQTLASKSLHLTIHEVQAIISFLHALTDEPLKERALQIQSTGSKH